MSNRINDGNMEQAGTGAWSEYPSGGITTLSKDPTIKHSGTQSLKVDVSGFTEFQYGAWAQPDGWNLGWFNGYSGGASLVNLGWKNILPDPGLVLAGLTHWTAINGAAVRKENGPGWRRMFIDYTGTAGAAVHTTGLFKAGNTYRVFGEAYNAPSIETGPLGSPTVRATGDGSFDFTFTAAADGELIIRHTGTTGTQVFALAVFDANISPNPPALYDPGVVYGSPGVKWMELGTSIEYGPGVYVDLAQRMFFHDEPDIPKAIPFGIRAIGSDGVIMAQWAAGDQYRFWLGLQDGRLKYSKPGQGLSVLGKTRINDGLFHVVFFQKRVDQYIDLYVDGVRDNANEGQDIWGYSDVNSTFGIAPGSGLDTLDHLCSFSGLDNLETDLANIEFSTDFLLDAGLANANAYQLISSPTSEATKIRGYAWGDGAGAIPIVAAKAPDWTDPRIIWFGDDLASEQAVDADILAGFDEITLGVKFANTGISNFDDFESFGLAVDDKMKKMENVIMGLLPPGEAWEPDPNRDFHKFMEGLGEGAGAIYQDLKALEYIRDPERTQQLADLEKDYGIITNLDISEDDRRAQLKILRYVRDLTGSDDNLEDRLQEAGFDLKVFRNDPKIDPAVLMCDELIVNGDIFTQVPAYEMQCDGSIAFAGNQKAVCGYFVSMERTAREYEIPTDPGLWGYFFFVCGDRQPAAEQNILDGDMELAGVTNWPAGPSSATSKDTSIKQAGDQSLKVEAVSNTDPQVLTPLQPQASYESILQSFDGTSEIPDLAWKNLLTDGTMSKPGPSAPDWLPLNNALNQKFQNTPLTGTIQHLRVFDQGTRNPAGYQLVFEAGKTYRVIGYGRGNGGSGIPQVETGPTGSPTVRWTGTSAFSWQFCNFTFTAAADGALILRANTSLLGDLAYFVMVGVYDITDGPSDPVYHDPATLTGGHLLVADGGPAILLDGSAGDYIDNNDQNLPSQYRWSAGQVTMWIRTTATDGVLHSQWLEGDPDSYIFYLDGGKLTWEKPARGLKLQSSATVNDGLFHQVIWQKSTITGQLKLYIDDQEDTPTTVTDFFPFANTTSRIGIQPGTPYEGAKFTVIGCLVDNGFYWNLATVQGTWAAFLDTRDNGSYSEQLIAPDILEARPIKGYVWGDGNGAIPAVYTRDPVSGDWVALWFGVDKTGRQVFNVECPPAGLDGIRLYTKFVEDGHCNFDEIDIRNLDFTSGTVPQELKEKLRRIILAYKPTRSWGCLLVNYV